MTFRAVIPRELPLSRRRPLPAQQNISFILLHHGKISLQVTCDDGCIHVFKSDSDSARSLTRTGSVSNVPPGAQIRLVTQLVNYLC